MWFFIIFVVIAIIAKFVYDSHQQSVQVNKEGGMLNKYALLVDHLMSGDSRSRITRQSSTSLDLGVATAGGATFFFLLQTFGKLTVTWKSRSPMFGDHELEWDFPEYLDQDKMIARIENDLEKYTANVLRANGYPGI